MYTILAGGERHFFPFSRGCGDGAVCMTRKRWEEEGGRVVDRHTGLSVITAKAL